jgi:hypothetical protein
MCAMAADKNPTSKPARARADRSAEARPAADAPNPVWFKPVMFGFMLIGLAWIVVFYVSPSGSWNILIGFGIMFIGFLMTTRWR